MRFGAFNKFALMSYAPGCSTLSGLVLAERLPRNLARGKLGLENVRICKGAGAKVFGLGALSAHGAGFEKAFRNYSPRNVGDFHLIVENAFSAESADSCEIG